MYFLLLFGFVCLVFAAVCLVFWFGWFVLVSILFDYVLWVVDCVTSCGLCVLVYGWSCFAVLLFGWVL